MGVLYSYLYYSNGAADGKEVDQNKQEEDREEEKKKGSDPSYTIQYPPQEAFFAQQAAEEQARRQADLALGKKVAKLPQDQWEMLSPEEKKKHLKRQRVKKLRQKKRQADRDAALESKRKELQPWLEDLSARQRANIREVLWKEVDDPQLLAYLSKRADMIKCPNRYCAVYFEKLSLDGKKKAPLVLGEDGKPISAEALENFLDNRFRCYHCEAIFCNACKTIPYHLGETCDQYKLRTSNPPCKVCKKPLPPPPDAAAKRDIICHADECTKMVYNLCTSIVPSCKHPCAGMKGQACMCLKTTCISAQQITQDGADFCNICWTDELEAGTCIKLNCGHIFHRHCVEQKLKHRWTGARISFNYANCPLCLKPIENTNDYTINSLLGNVKDLRNEVKIKAMHFLKVEGMLEDLKDPKHKFHGRAVDYAIEVFSFYMCHVCKSPYYGGKRQCGDILHFDPEELVCGGCSGLLSCNKENHGRKYIHYKCRFCCNIASWFCFGRVHYCESCHNNPYEYWASNNTLSAVPPQCKGKEFCPLGIEHPPNGFEEMSLGCSRCKLEEAGVIMEDDKEGDENYDDDDLYY